MTSRIASSTAGAAVVLLLSSCTTGEEPQAQATSAAIETTALAEPADEPTVSDLTLKSCGEILRAMVGIDEAIRAVTDDVTAAPEAFAQVADNLRAAADDAGEDISAATEELAAALDDIADKLRAGDLLNLDLDAITPAVGRLAEVCNG